MTLADGNTYHIRRTFTGVIQRLVYKGSAGKDVHWFEDPEHPPGGQFLSESEFVLLGEQLPLDLTAAGDAMQSAASRLASGVRCVGADRALGYEDSMALCELDSAVQAWTEARR